jgi:hypothetical protein
MEYIDIQAFTYEQRPGMLDELTVAVCNCGGWIVDRKALSPTAMRFEIEIQLYSVLDLYASILTTGIELSRPAHETLTELCTRRKHRILTASAGHIVALRLDISFLDEVSIHSQAGTPSASA